MTRSEIPSNAEILFPKEKTPYLIVAPQYTAMSAGVRVLHMLCHTLNMLGERAYITIYPQLVIDADQANYTCPDLATPLMTQEILDYFEDRGRPPIVVYLEAVRNNPLHATHVVRYALNYPGLLGGDTAYAETETLFAYSRRIAERMGIGEERVVFMPVSDPGIFYPPPPGTVRNGSCFYASKYRDILGGKLLPVTDKSVEITRHQPDSLTKPQIADLFRHSEVFYTYEDTALSIEAALCGCPVVCLPNEFFQESLGLKDLGTEAFAWGNTPEQVAYARATVDRFPANYAAVIDRYWTHLRLFIKQTQTAALESKQPFSTIKLPGRNRLHSIAYVIDYMQQYGLRRTCMKAANFVRKFGLRKILRQTLKNLTA